MQEITRNQFRDMLYCGSIKSAETIFIASAIEGGVVGALRYLGYQAFGADSEDICEFIFNARKTPGRVDIPNPDAFCFLKVK